MQSVRLDGAEVATRRRLDVRQRAALVAPPLLIATTLPVFHAARAIFGDSLGGHGAWFAGMSFYWVLWGGLFAVWMVGPSRTRTLIRPIKPTRQMAAHVAFVVAMAAAIRFLVPGMAYDKPTILAASLLLISPFANGLFEELLWRGVYLVAFSDRPFLRVVWPSVWFGLWHLVPGSIAADGPHLAMVVGPFFMGLYFAYLAKKSNSVWWPMVAHALGGLVMVS